LGDRAIGFKREADASLSQLVGYFFGTGIRWRSSFQGLRENRDGSGGVAQALRRAHHDPGPERLLLRDRRASEHRLQLRLLGLGQIMEAAVVLCVDEKSQVQALARSQPAFPIMPGMPEKRTHDYLRHGTTSLFAAFNTADGTVISSLHRCHRTIEFKKLLQKIDIEVPDDLDVHLVCDNYGTHKSPAIHRRLAAHPRFHMHHRRMYSSWINQVERWFSYLANDLLRRSDHRSVQALEKDIRA
jgi:hypothetical protein